MSYSVANPEDRFSNNVAQITLIVRDKENDNSSSAINVHLMFPKSKILKIK